MPRDPAWIWLARLAALVAAPLAFFGCIEGVAWLAGVAPLRDDPGFAEWNEAQVCHYGGDPESFCTRPPLPDAEGRRVVAVLGGSSVYGYPKGMKPFPHRMRSLLEERAPGEFAVRNYGLFCKDSIFVRRCAETLARLGDASVLVIYSGHNDFLNFMRPPGPRALAFLESHPWLIGVRSWLAGRRSYSWLVRSRGESSKEWNRLPSPAFEEAFEVVLDGFVQNLEAIVETARERGIDVVLVTVVSNVSEFPYAEPEWDAGLAEGRNPPEWDPWRVHFADGVARTRAGDHAAAYRSFSKARDVLPMGRAPSQLDQAIRDLARRHPEVAVVDVEREIETVAASEPIGCEFFGDQTNGVEWCDPFHPSERLHRLIAESIVRQLVPERRVPRVGPSP